MLEGERIEGGTIGQLMDVAALGQEAEEIGGVLGHDIFSPSRLREGLGEGCLARPSHALPQPLPQAGGESQAE
ncbi:hypothetical protein GCM10011395_17760 [Sphingomonas psychrolutea]|uniref:Uncharacterized protein n=1 Tax=Sphingomonas psychrolutea TaxID=1259676 RepID=A0ABQ1GPT9_9SPHN|nr:hypothetical protein GCM10011395_17760 [Sphingomonas psychrolutea]